MAITLRQIQIGKETVWGTEVNGAARFMGLSDFKLVPRSVNTQKRYLVGNYSPAHRMIQTFTNGTATMSGDFTFDDFVYIPLCGMQGGVTGATSGTAKAWAFAAPVATATAVESRTIEGTDGVDPYTLTGCNVGKFTLSGGSGEDSLVQFTADWLCKTAAAKAIQAAISDRVPNLLPALKMELWADDIGATIGTTKLDVSLIDWKYSFGGYITHTRRAAGALTPTAVRYSVPDITLEVTMESNTTTKAEMAKYLAATGRLVQLKGAGAVVGVGPDTELLNIQLAGDWTSDPSLWDSDNADTTFKMTLKPRYDSGAFAGYNKLVVQNNLAAVVG
jgi:hypothetical protein